MSKILFVENRFRTGAWKPLAIALQREGHEVFWLVENHAFAPSKEYGKVFVIPYPSKKDLKTAPEYHSQFLPSSDRNFNYFGHKDTRHYGYYYEKFFAILKDVMPDLVLGESTTFYEQLIIDACQKLGIRFLHPCFCRYPTGRFSFYKNNTLEPYRGSGEDISDEAADAIIASVSERKIVPDYMKKKKVSLETRLQRFADLCLLTWHYYSGEHYHTPSPFRKITLNRELKQRSLRWESIATRKYSRIEGKEFKVMYPLHLQPEASVDVWGNPYRDQVKTIRMILAELPSNALLVVKPNPHAKYEMSEEMLTLIDEEPRVIPVPLPTPMSEVLSRIDLVVTVTGTIAIESIFSGKPVITLIHTLNNTVAACPYAADAEALRTLMAQAAAGTFPTATQQEKRDFLRLLNRTSYAGKPYENYLTDPEEFEKVLTAVKAVL